MSALFPFIKLFKKQLWWIILGIALSYITILSSIGLLSLSGWFISAAAYASLSYNLASNFNFFLPAAGVRFFSMARIGGRYGERLSTHEATFKILTDIRVWFYEKVEPFVPEQLIHYKSGDLLTRIVTDIDALDSLYIRIILPFIVFVMTVVFVLVFFSFFSIKIALISAGTLVLAAVSIPIFSSIIARKTSRALTAKTAKLKTETIEYVQGLAVLKLFKSDHLKVERLKSHSSSLVNEQRKMSHYTGLGSMMMTIFLGISIVLAVWIACDLVSNDRLNGANIALLALGVIGMYESVLVLPVAFQYIGKIILSAERLLKVVDEKPVVFGEVAAVKEDFQISFNQIYFTYPSQGSEKIKPVLNNVNITFNPKEKIAIVGSTGSGKTTLINLLSRFWQPTSGTIQVAGIDLTEYSESSIRDMFIIVPQNDHIFNTTIRKNLLLSNPHATQEMMEEVLKVVFLDKYIQGLSLGLDSPTGENGCKLSGGQRKRLVLARALLKNASVYIFDEPTEGLDKKTENNLMDSMLNYLNEKMLIIITHSMTAAQKMNRHLSVANGKLIDV